MACNNYLPRFQDQINPNDPLGSTSCTCYSGAMAADYDTCGGKVPTGKEVRKMTGDTSGGTSLPQVDYALRKGWGVDLDTRIGSARLTWDQFAAKIDAGHGAILQGSYLAIHNTKYEGDKNFIGNHAIFVPPGWGVMDPLCDGRRTGIYKYHGEAYPKDLLKRFAGLLMLDEKKKRRLGEGLVWCSLTRDNTSIWRASVQPKKDEKTRMFYQYIIKNGIIVDRIARYTTGFTHTVTPPKLYRADSSQTYKNKSLVKILTGTSRKGWYINAGWAKEY